MYSSSFNNGFLSLRYVLFLVNMWSSYCLIVIWKTVIGFANKVILFIYIWSSYHFAQGLVHISKKRNRG